MHARTRAFIVLGQLDCQQLCQCVQQQACVVPGPRKQGMGGSKVHNHTIFADVLTRVSHELYFSRVNGLAD